MDRHFVEECISNSKMRGIVDSDDEKWLLSENPSNNDQVEEEEDGDGDGDGDGDEEALSLCDLPIIEENRQSRKETIPPPKPIVDSSEDFNFCPWGDPISKESEMCAADEVFFQGQILPMRHSISFDNGVILTSRSTSRCLSRSESMGHSSSYSAGFTSASSRSSSINSHHSSISSGSSTNSSASITLPKIKSRCPKIPNQFQFSHPSPKPQIRHSKSKNRGNASISSNQNSTFLSFLRTGLVTTPDIAMQDLKFRSKSHNSSKNFGSRNSTSSINSTTIKETGDKKQWQQHQRKFFDKNSVFFSGCKCSSNSVVGPIPSRVPSNAVTRSASAKGVDSHADQEDDVRTTKKHQETGRKQSSSRHRTFEWLRQLSLEAAPASPV